MSDISASLGVETRSAPAAGGSALLAQIAAGLSAGHELEPVLERFLEPVIQIAGAQAGAVRILDHDHRLLRLVGSRGLPEAVVAVEHLVEHDCGACGAAMRADTPLWAEELGTCLRRAGGQYFGSGCRRMLAVPLQHRGRVMGVYNLFFSGNQAPAPEALRLLRSVGELIGLALDNARLERENLRATLLAERQTMAADVHDSIGQSLAFVKMRLPLLRDAIDTGQSERVGRYFDDVRAAVGQAHASLRAVLTQLRAPMDPLGLAHALADAVQRFRRDCDTELEFSDQLAGAALSADQEMQVYHIVQEALSNIARHAAAGHARLHLGLSAANAVRIVVEDDGAGLPPSAREGGTHYGMAVMFERARRLGGSLSVAPRAGGGTRVQLDFALVPAVAIGGPA